MSYYVHSVFYFALFAAGMACGILHERYRIAHRRRAGLGCE